MKEEFKRLKAHLKEWNREVFGTMDIKIKMRRKEIHELDTIDEVFGLEEQEIMRSNEQRAYLLRDLKLLASILT